MDIRFHRSLLGQFIVFGIAPCIAVAVLSAAVGGTRIATLLRGRGEKEVLVNAQGIAANINDQNNAAIHMANILASAAEHGFFGKREESMSFTRQVLEQLPDFYGVHYCYEPNADGKDSMYLKANAASNAPTNGIDAHVVAGAKNAGASLPAAAIDANGRFIPYWFRDSSQGDKIALKPLAEFENPWYQSPLRNWRDNNDASACHQ